jgi:hypothetical protein
MSLSNQEPFVTAKDLRKEPPRSPHERIHDYVILARTLDKCRAFIHHSLGDYHFDCPLDNMLFSFKGIRSGEFLEKVKSGATDEEIGHWLDTHGSVQTPGSISTWSKNLDSYRPYDDPEKKVWMEEQCKTLGLNPAETTLFSFLEADDKAAFPKALQKARDPNNWDLPMVETASHGSPAPIKATVHE